METMNYELNEKTVSVIIQLYTHLKMEKEAITLYTTYNYDNFFVSSSMIKMFILLEKFNKLI